MVKVKINDITILEDTILVELEEQINGEFILTTIHKDDFYVWMYKNGFFKLPINLSNTDDDDFLTPNQIVDEFYKNDSEFLHKILKYLNIN